MMKRNRLEAFSDGVLAIIITIMILELKAPDGSTFSDLKESVPVFISYVLSFVYIAIYWNNHHHLVNTIDEVSCKILWANMHWLFWISTILFATSWMGANLFTVAPTFLYAFSLTATSIAYLRLQKAILQKNGKDTILLQTLEKDIKGKTSLVLYIISMGLSFGFPMISYFLFIMVAVIWFIPDRRIEKYLLEKNN